MKKAERVTVSLDEETADLLEQIADEVAEGNRSMGARRAIQTAARILLDPQPAYRAPARRAPDAAYVS
jgi:hypothetical protein